ncbi:MAG: hypothetical protein EXR62_10195 [Chloroflexi bacterium]|nr:hypothetical protein [Chloroflexota bacterium]
MLAADTTYDLPANGGMPVATRRVQPTNSFIPFAMAEIEQSVPARFEQQVARTPDRLAVKTNSQEFTYTALNQAANRVAWAILERCGPRVAAVALLLEHGAPVPVALLGVMKAGKILVPLDPSFPPARLSYILEDVGAVLVVTNQANLEAARRVLSGQAQILNMDEIDPATSPANPNLDISPETLASISYTSGSTGQPKGVMDNHRRWMFGAMSWINNLHICATDRFLMLASVSAAAARADIIPPLFSGATIYMYNLKSEGLGKLAAFMVQHEITIYHSIPTVFRHFCAALTGAESFPHVRLILLGGEPISKRDTELFKKHFGAHTLMRIMMAATECGAICSYYIDEHTEIHGRPAIGYPTAGQEVLLWDENDQDVGFNQIGEIVVRSPFMSLGYWGKPELTDAVFQPDPAGGPARIYRTGDLGRRRPDGLIEHMGRKDQQVKIRGSRVDLTEIENLLLELPAIAEVVVVGQEGRLGELELVAYVAAEPPAPAVAEVRSYLNQKLAAYMVPTAFVFLETLPKTPNGKVDRKALPRPDLSQAAATREYVASRTPVEAMLAACWAEVLKLERVGIEDNFFELGGHSLLAAQIIARLIPACGVELPVQAFFEAPTVAQMAQRLEETGSIKPQTEDDRPNTGPPITPVSRVAHRMTRTGDGLVP